MNGLFIPNCGHLVLRERQLVKASPPRTRPKSSLNGAFCVISTKQAHARKGASAAGGPMGTAVNCPSIDGIIQKAEEVVRRGRGRAGCNAEQCRPTPLRLTRSRYGCLIARVWKLPRDHGAGRAHGWSAADLSGPLRQNAARENRARSCVRGCDSGRRATAGAGTHCLGITSRVAV